MVAASVFDSNGFGRKATSKLELPVAATNDANGNGGASMAAPGNVESTKQNAQT